MKPEIIKTPGIDPELQAFLQNTIKYSIGEVDSNPAVITNYIWQGDGMYQVENRALGRFCFKKGDIKTPGVPNVVKETVYLRIPKLPFTIFQQMLNWFREVYQELKSEAYCRVYFNKSENTFFIYIPKQEVQGALVEWDRRYDTGLDLYDNDPNYILALQVHSHNVMGGSFSGQDARDQKALDGIYMVIGTITTSPSYQIRYGAEDHKVDLRFDEIFEVPADMTDMSFAAGWKEKMFTPGALIIPEMTARFPGATRAYPHLSGEYSYPKVGWSLDNDKAWDATQDFSDFLNGDTNWGEIDKAKTMEEVRAISKGQSTHRQKSKPKLRIKY